MARAKMTGMSNITGKTVAVRHATMTDLVNVEEYLRHHNKAYNLAKAEVVVAVEDERLIGFGILEISGDAGCVSIMEEKKRRGIGTSIVEHLLEYAPVKNIYIDVCPE